MSQQTRGSGATTAPAAAQWRGELGRGHGGVASQSARSGGPLTRLLIAEYTHSSPRRLCFPLQGPEARLLSPRPRPPPQCRPSQVLQSHSCCSVTCNIAPIPILHSPFPHSSIACPLLLAGCKPDCSQSALRSPESRDQDTDRESNVTSADKRG